MFSIGTFSKIAQVSITLLRFYDGNDLFKPAYVDPESGYRYYTIDQLPTLNRILALRDLDLSLEQITRLMQDDVSTDDIRSMLLLKEAQIKQTLDEEERRLRKVKSRLKQLGEDGMLSEHDVVLKSIPIQYLISLREIVPDKRNMGHSFYLVHEGVQNKGLKNVGHCIAIFHSSAFVDDHVDWELGFLLQQPITEPVTLPDGRVMIGRELPPVENMATVIHAGPWHELHLGYGALGKWLDVNRYELIDSAREIFLRLPDLRVDNRDPITEIQFPVASIQS